jgi:hypothetical protein
MPILGIMASSFRSGAGPVGAYDSLATVTLSATTATVIFAGIPSDYKHLQIRCMARSTFASTTCDMYISDTTPSSTTTIGYTHIMRGNGATVTAEIYNAGIIEVGRSSISGSTAGASIFNGVIIDLLDYTSTNKRSTYRSLSGVDLNGSGTVAFQSGGQAKTLPTSQLTLSCDGSFVQYSSFALYGVK